jgi:hypothetical protein
MSNRSTRLAPSRRGRSAGSGRSAGHPTDQVPAVKRRLAPLLAAVVLVGTFGTLATGCLVTEGTTPITSCTSTSGVIVAVDFSHFDTAVWERGCDTTITTGYGALHAAGFTTAGDEHDGPTFICRINNDPPPSEDPCINTPPATAFWSYWHANAGASKWTLSSLGAASYVPKPGSVDAWAFGAGQPPTFTPAQVRN